MVGQWQDRFDETAEKIKICRRKSTIYDQLKMSPSRKMKNLSKILKNQSVEYRRQLLSRDQGSNVSRSLMETEIDSEKLRLVVREKFPIKLACSILPDKKKPQTAGIGFRPI